MNFVSPQKFFCILDQLSLGEIVTLILKQLPMTPWCPMYWGVKTPWCPMHQKVETPRSPRHRGVQKFDLLKIQNGPMYRGLMTTQCPMYWGVVFCFFEPSSPCNSL